MNPPTDTATVSLAMDDQGKLARAAAVSTKRDASVGMDQGMRVLSYLIAGVGVYGFLGWLGDRLLGTGFLLPIGIVAGAGFGIYVIIRRFGPDSSSARGHGVSTATPDQTSIDKTEGAQ